MLLFHLSQFLETEIFFPFIYFHIRIFLFTRKQTKTKAQSICFINKASIHNLVVKLHFFFFNENSIEFNMRFKLPGFEKVTREVCFHIKSLIVK